MGVRKVSTVKILTAAIATGAVTSHEPWNHKRTFHADGIVSAATGSATIAIEVSNTDDPDTFVVGGTITLSLTTTISGDGFTTDAPWRFVRANVTAISGTDATVNVTMGLEK